MKMIKLSSLRSNPNNPRTIKDEKFEQLKKSLETFPEMMDLRPIIVIGEERLILAGNMRFKALEALGRTEIPVGWVKSANGLSKEQIQEFIIKDNLPFGEWDFETLANEWEIDDLSDWGLEIPNFDISPLDDDEENPDGTNTFVTEIMLIRNNIANTLVKKEGFDLSDGYLKAEAIILKSLKSNEYFSD